MSSLFSSRVAGLPPSMLLPIALAAGLSAQVLQPRPEIALITECVDQGSAFIIVGNGFGTAPEVWLWQPGADKSGVRETAFSDFSLPETPPEQAKKAALAGKPSARAIAAIQIGALAKNDAVIPTVAWVKADGGISKPYFFNKPEVWFLSEPEVLPGQRLRIFGRNLAPVNGRTAGAAYLYPVALRNTATRRTYWADVLEANIQDNPNVKPYQLNVAVPRDLPPGDYELAIHVLHGGPAAWSNSVKVKAVSSQDWIKAMARPADHSRVTPRWQATAPPAVIEVKGLKTDGLTDNSAAIQRALDLAGSKAPGLVVLPAGNLAISKTLHVPEGVILQGSGRAATQLVVAPHRPITGGIPIPQEKLFQSPAGKAARISSRFVGMKDDTPMVWLESKSGLADLSVLVGEASNLAVLVATADIAKVVTDTFLKRVEIKNRVGMTFAPDVPNVTNCGGIHVVSPTRGFTMLDNVVEAPVPLLMRQAWATHRYALLRGNAFRNVPAGRYEALALHNIADSIIEENEMSNGRRALFGHRGWHHLYIAENRVHNIAGGGNAGEIFMAENPAPAWRGKVVRADGANLEVDFETGFDEDRVTQGGRILAAYLVNGNGAGQYRHVVGNRGRVLKLESAFRVPPEPGSWINVLTGTSRNLFVNNRIWNTRGQVQLSYGAMFECVIAGTEMYNGGGITMWGFSRPNKNDGYSPTAYNLAVNNRMVNSRGINLITVTMEERAKAEDLSYTYSPLFANTVRRNQIWNPSMPWGANQYYNTWWNPQSFGATPPIEHEAGVSVSGGWNTVEANFMYRNQTAVWLGQSAHGIVRQNRIDFVERPLVEQGAHDTYFEPGPQSVQKGNSK